MPIDAITLQNEPQNRNPDGSIAVIAVNDDWGTGSQKFTVRIASPRPAIRPAATPPGASTRWAWTRGGYPSDIEATNVDLGFGECRAGQPSTAFGDGVVTPHAAFLALPYAPNEAMRNLAKLRADFPGAYGRGGFKDAIAVRSGRIADRYLSLDQGMIMGALGNALRDDAIRRYFVQGDVQRVIRPLLRIETFNAQP